MSESSADDKNDLITSIRNLLHTVVELIDRYKSLPKIDVLNVSVNTSINISPGEEYVGSIINADGTGHAIILLHGDKDDATWQKQMDWAKSIGGDLPTRAEQNMLFDCHRDQFKPDWYWSNQRNDKGDAWCQHFHSGLQYNTGTGLNLRARAIRRVNL